MAKEMVETLVDDLDGSAATETIRLGWNGDWREIDLSKRNATALSHALDRYWAAARPVSVNGDRRRRRPPAKSRAKKSDRDPKAMRSWALAQGIDVPARGRIPAEVERQYHEANGDSSRR
jgi:Lsr2